MCQVAWRGEVSARTEIAAMQRVAGRGCERVYGLGRKGPDGADVDFAQDVGVVAGLVPRAVEEVGVPDHRQGSGGDAENLLHLRYPLLLHLGAQPLVSSGVG